MKYVAFYDTDEYKHENRSVALCAVNVVNYIVDILSDIEEVEIVSPARSKNAKGIYKSRRIEINNRVLLTLPFSIGVRSPIGRFFSVLYTRVWLLFYLLRNLKKEETIVAYHSLSTMWALKILKKIKNPRLVLEVREIYSDARRDYEEFGNRYDRKRKIEMDYFDIADSYIFPSQLLNDIVNKNGKPYVISPGIYKTEIQQATSKWNDGKTHVVYAGTLRQAKGAFIAVDLAKILPENYHIHILGNGPEERIKLLKEKIAEVTGTGKASVSYDGELRGEEFKLFLQKCDIGIAPQDPQAAFTNTSFPSKILTYLANGLDVVSIRIPAVENSPVGKYLYFYDNNDINELAETIRTVSIKDPEDKVQLLYQLDKELRVRMRELIHEKRDSTRI